MRRLNLAEGTLVLMGFLLILNVAILKVKDINLLTPLVNDPVGMLAAANTCFIIAFVISIFGGKDKDEE
ncbi:hypothetical protein ACFL4E_00390 [Candidatus Omnitrophota bacterium]